MLKTPEAAEFLGVSEDTLKRWRRRTKREDQLVGPPWTVELHGLQRTVVYSEDDLNLWKNRTVTA